MVPIALTLARPMIISHAFSPLLSPVFGALAFTLAALVCGTAAPLSLTL